MYLPALVLEEGIATGLEVPMVVMAALHSITEFQRPRKWVFHICQRDEQAMNLQETMIQLSLTRHKKTLAQDRPPLHWRRTSSFLVRIVAQP